MAYRSHINPRQRGAAIAAVIAIHAALLTALLSLSGKIDIGNPESELRTIDLRQLLPSPRQDRPRTVKKSAKTGSAPKNITSQATPVVAPKRAIKPEPTVVASTTSRQGVAPTQGASPQAGTGTGSGGTGAGTGAAGTGSGEVTEPPHLASPVLGGRDFSNDLLKNWPPGATIFLRLRIDPRGYVAECLVDRGSGIGAIDGTICNLAHDRLRFRPALDRNGQAVAGWFGYAQPAPR